MKTRTKTALGVDIGDRRISAALVEKTGEGVKVIAAATEECSAGEARAKTTVPGRALSRVLRKLGRRARSHQVQIAVTSSMPSAMLRLLDLPKQMPANVGELVDGELKQYVAMSGRRMSSDFCGIGMGSGARKRLLAVAADAAEVAETLGICAAARVAVQSIEPAALACVRALLLDDRDLRRGLALVAMLTPCNVVLCSFCNGILDFVRTRDLPAGLASAESLHGWLCEELNAVLRYSGNGAPDEASQWQVRLVLRDAGFARDAFADLPARLPGVKTLTVLDSRDPVEAVAGGENAGTTAASMMAVGAASKLLDLDADELRIDLTPDEVIAARSSSRRGLIAANVAAVVFLAIFLLVQLLARTTDAMSRRIEQNRLDGQLRTMPARVAQDRFVDAEILRMRRELAGLDAIRTRGDVEWSSVLSAIGEAAPAGVCVTHVAGGDGRSVLVKGMALSHGEARAFVQNMESGTPFESVRLTRVQRLSARGDVVEYEIDCTLKSLTQENHGGQ
jgi:hypothetical protein